MTEALFLFTLCLHRFGLRRALRWLCCLDKTRVIGSGSAK
jgi:hypothetical protein